MSVLPLGEVLERLARSDASGLDTLAEASYRQYMHTRSPEQLSVELMEVLCSGVLSAGAVEWGVVLVRRVLSQLCSVLEEGESSPLPFVGPLRRLALDLLDRQGAHYTPLVMEAVAAVADLPVEYEDEEGWAGLREAVAGRAGSAVAGHKDTALHLLSRLAYMITPSLYHEEQGGTGLASVLVGLVGEGLGAGGEGGLRALHAVVRLVESISGSYDEEEAWAPLLKTLQGPLYGAVRGAGEAGGEAAGRALVLVLQLAETNPEWVVPLLMEGLAGEYASLLVPLCSNSDHAPLALQLLLAITHGCPSTMSSLSLPCPGPSALPFPPIALSLCLHHLSLEEEGGGAALWGLLTSLGRDTMLPLASATITSTLTSPNLAHEQAVRDVLGALRGLTELLYRDAFTPPPPPSSLLPLLAPFLSPSSLPPLPPPLLTSLAVCGVEALGGLCHACGPSLDTDPTTAQHVVSVLVSCANEASDGPVLCSVLRALSTFFSSGPVPPAPREDKGRQWGEWAGLACQVLQRGLQGRGEERAEAMQAIHALATRAGGGVSGVYAPLCSSLLPLTSSPRLKGEALHCMASLAAACEAKDDLKERLLPTIVSDLCDSASSWSDFDPAREGLLHGACVCITSLGSASLPFLPPLLQGPITHALESQDEEEEEAYAEEEQEGSQEEDMGSAATQEKALCVSLLGRLVDVSIGQLDLPTTHSLLQRLLHLLGPAYRGGSSTALRQHCRAALPPLLRGLALSAPASLSASLRQCLGPLVLTLQGKDQGRGRGTLDLRSAAVEVGRTLDYAFTHTTAHAHGAGLSECELCELCSVLLEAHKHATRRHCISLAESSLHPCPPPSLEPSLQHQLSSCLSSLAHTHPASLLPAYASRLQPFVDQCLGQGHVPCADRAFALSAYASMLRHANLPPSPHATFSHLVTLLGSLSEEGGEGLAGVGGPLVYALGALAQHTHTSHDPTTTQHLWRLLSPVLCSPLACPQSSSLLLLGASLLFASLPCPLDPLWQDCYSRWLALLPPSSPPRSPALRLGSSFCPSCTPSGPCPCHCRPLPCVS